MSKVKPKARHSEIVVQEFGDEILIYDLKNNKAFNLNETSALIWRLSDGNNDISDITQGIIKKYNSNVSEEFVWLALEQFRKDELIEDKEEIIPFLTNISRRELVRKVGLTSIIALPIVSSLIAPLSSNAASACSTAIPPASPPGTGGLQCRCDCAVSNGSTCGSGLAVDNCNPGCTCTRTAGSCYGGADPTLIGTALGSCA